ncbi:hypothetical protein Skr01_57290 [Sphaerisporangium krabiense]|uniref:Uncharacterized protein n=1 Tax=Sphaerisporangium krabiense TaxID=763782 RepID=A0A7W8Z8M1_9ACTN|nr:hypothetical protein [Sphaerisporangium krabiense]MBB5629504.1 hypothetical protein [Sphaerisporangium krabiense]GII65644.1 hypothetical protein Skr01_57290 [Sphaerisporangium krabiense]
MPRNTGPNEEEALIEELLGELIELREENARLRGPDASVTDLNAYRKRSRS